MIEKISHLELELNKLALSSREAVEGSNELDAFKAYIHIPRKIEEDFTNILLSEFQKSSGVLIILNGNVGDGKSHLLASVNSKSPEILKNFYVHNDSTESYYPDMTSEDTLLKILAPFMDINIDENLEKIILAVNLGVLFRLCENPIFIEKYSKINSLIKESKIFNQVIGEVSEDSHIKIISFSDYSFFDLNDSGIESIYLSSLFDKIAHSSMDNPFYSGYVSDSENMISSTGIKNYELFLKSSIRKKIIELIIEGSVKSKLILNTREILNFLYDLLMQKEKDLFTALFYSQERSSLLMAISRLNPLFIRNRLSDSLIFSGNFFKANIEKKVIETYFLDEKLQVNYRDPIFDQFIKSAYLCRSLDRREIRNVGDKILLALLLLKNQDHTLKNLYIITKELGSTFKIAHKLDCEVVRSFEKSKNFNFSLQAISIDIVFKNSHEQYFPLSLDYQGYSLITEISKGFRPGKQQLENAALLKEFFETISTQWIDYTREIYINSSTGETIEISMEKYENEIDYNIKEIDN